MKDLTKIKRTSLIGIEPRAGELIITKISRAKRQGELIRDAAEIIYTPRKAGVLPGHDITTDKWRFMAIAKQTIDVDKLEQRIKLMNPEEKGGEGEGQGKTA